MPLETLVTAPVPSETAPPAPAALEEVARTIARDAASQAGEYLSETEVPHGGE